MVSYTHPVTGINDFDFATLDSADDYVNDPFRLGVTYPRVPAFATQCRN